MRVREMGNGRDGVGSEDEGDGFRVGARGREPAYSWKGVAGVSGGSECSCQAGPDHPSPASAFTGSPGTAC